MGILQDLLKKGKGQVGLILKLTCERFFLLAQIVAGASLHIDENSREADPFEIRAVFSVERLAAGADKLPDARTLELAECRFEIFVILDGDGVHPKGSGHLDGIAHRTPTAFLTSLSVSVEAFHLLCTIGKEENFRPLYISETF